MGTLITLTKNYDHTTTDFATDDPSIFSASFEIGDRASLIENLTDKLISLETPCGSHHHGNQEEQQHKN
jgi:hypothetical protein